MRRHLICLAAALLFACPGPARETTPRPDEVRLVVLHTNDTHGYVWGTGETGSAAQRATLIERERAEIEAAGGVSLLLDAGDVRTGTFCSDHHRAAPDLEAMSVMGYDAMVVGNHEFDQPFGLLLEQRAGLSFPILGANVLDAATGRPLFDETALIERGGLRIGILGLVTTESVTTSTRGADPALRFVDEVEVARRLVPALRQRADVVIVLSHLGFEADRALARQVEGIDLIVGGHSHTLLEAPVTEGRTVIVQAGCYQARLGRVELRVGRDGVALVGGRLLPIPRDLPADPDVAAVLDRFACVAASEVLATLDEPITHEPLAGLGTSSALSNLIADALREQAGTDLAIVNRGGIRTDLPAGQITPAHVHAVLPFDNPVVILRASGQALLAIARSVRSRGRDGHGILFTSGMTFRFGPGDETAVLVGGAPPDPSRQYTIALSGFIARGGDGHDAIASLERVRELDVTTAEAFARYLRSHDRIVADGRSRTIWVDAPPAEAPADPSPKSSTRAPDERPREIEGSVLSLEGP